MSFSKPFFGDKAGYKKKQITGYDDDTEFNALHWTKQLQLRPLNPYKDKVRPAYDYGDKSMYFDMDHDPNISNDKETT